MANSNFSKKMKDLKKFWKGAKEEAKSGSFGSEVEDGRYFATISGAEIGESQASGRLQIGWEFPITEGDYAGEVVRDYQGLESEENLSYVFRRLAQLGYDIEGMEADDLEEVLKDVVKSNLQLRIRLKTKGDFQNIYIDKLLGSDESDDEEEDDEGNKASEAKKSGKTSKKKDPDPEPEEEEEEETDLDDLDLKGLLKYAKDNDIDLSGLSKKDLKDEDKVREAISEASSEDEEEDEEEEEEEDVDLDEMSLKDLLAYAKEKEIDLSDLTKKELKDEDKVREAISEALEEDEEEEDDEDDEDDEDEVELAVGMKIEYSVKGKDFTGKILKIDEDAGTAKVQPEGSSKVHTVSVDEITVIDEGDDD